MVIKEGWLTRAKDSMPQVETGSKSLRRENVEGNFVCPDKSQNDLTGARVIVVDDVATTGSTLSACAKALKDAGAASVWGLTLAREE